MHCDITISQAVEDNFESIGGAKPLISSTMGQYTPLSMKTSIYHSLLYLITPIHQEGVIRFLKTPLDERVISVLEGSDITLLAKIEKYLENIIYLGNI